MIVSIDTNVLSTLLLPGDPDGPTVAGALDEFRSTDELLVTGFVFAELMGGQRSARELDAFLKEMRVAVDWQADERLWRAAGEAFSGYCARRKARQRDESRRLMTDFLIGAHARVRGCAVLTRDKRIFRAAYPDVVLLRL